MEKICNRIAEILSIIFWGAAFLFPLLNYSHLPDKIAVHYNLAGQADGWAGRGMVWMAPILATLFYIGLSVLQRYPRIFNYPVGITEQNRQYLYEQGTNLVRYLKLILVMIFTFMSYHLSYNSGHIPTGYLSLLIVAMFGVIIYFVLKMMKCK